MSVMKDIKIRYTYKRKQDGKIWQELIPMRELREQGADHVGASKAIGWEQ